MHGEIEYFSATSMYAAYQAGIEAVAPYVEAQDASGKWVRVMDDMGFPAGGPRTMTADLTDKLPQGTRRIRITTNLQIYWDNILINRTQQEQERPAHAGSAGARRSALPRLPPEGRKSASRQRAVRLRERPARLGPTRGPRALTRATATCVRC